MSAFFDVFDYWKDKAITEDGRVVIEAGYEGADDDFDIQKSIPVIVDWREPRCFACNDPLFYEDDDLDTPSLKDLWDNKTKAIHSAQRAHIVPKAKKGDNEASNIFCLCPRCHLESPDSTFETEFFRWIYQRRKKPAIFVAVNECIKRGILPLFYPEDLDKANTHGVVRVTSSIVAAFVGSAEERCRPILNTEYCKSAISVLRQVHFDEE